MIKTSIYAHVFYTFAQNLGVYGIQNDFIGLNFEMQIGCLLRILADGCELVEDISLRLVFM